MNQLEVLKELNKFSLENRVPLEDMYIFMSGSLVLQNVKETCNDIDLMVDIKHEKRLLEKLKPEKVTIIDGLPLYSYKDFDLYFKDNINKDNTYIRSKHGMNVETILAITHRKLEWFRDKDIDHLVDIYIYLLNKIHNGGLREDDHESIRMISRVRVVGDRVAVKRHNGYKAERINVRRQEPPRVTKETYNPFK